VRPGYRCNSMLSVTELVRAGLGVARCRISCWMNTCNRWAPRWRGMTRRYGC